jgi:sarcosine oxidase gamma subunit
MFDRSEFWSPLPVWREARLEGHALTITPVAIASAWLLSGESTVLLARAGITASSGPRDVVRGERYALRLAPDRLLLLNAGATVEHFGWQTDGWALSDVSDGWIAVDVLGEGAAAFMAQGSEYVFAAPPVAAQESAQLLFGGLKVAVSRRPAGWRLHVERPWAAALWHWLAAHTAGSGLDSFPSRQEARPDPDPESEDTA